MQDFKYLESKTADYCYIRGDDWHLGFILGDEVLSIEYIPANWPAVTIIKKPAEEYRKETIKTVTQNIFKCMYGFFRSLI